MSWQKRAAHAKALENIGGLIGNYMTQSALAEERDQRELAREERADQRLLEREQRADERKIAEEQRKVDAEEAKQAKIGKQTKDAYEGAEGVAAERRATGLLASAEGMSKDAITKPNGERYERWADGKTEEEIKQKALEQVKGLTPEARAIYEERGMLAKESDPRLQKYLDASESAAKSGAHRETLDHFEKAKAKVLEEIKAENAVKVADIRADTALKVAEINTDKALAVAGIRANNAGGSGGGDANAKVVQYLESARKENKDQTDALRRMMEAELSSGQALTEAAKAAVRKKYKPQLDALQTERQKLDEDFEFARTKLGFPMRKPAATEVAPPPPSVKPAVTTETKPAPVAGAFKTGASKVIQSGPNKGKTAVFDGTGWLLKN